METTNNTVRIQKDYIYYLEETLSGFKTMSLQFTLKGLERIHLGPDEKKGDIWRGGFGEALRSLACFYRWEPTECVDCDKLHNCFYYIYFESDKPHPYVMHPALDTKEVYGKGDEINLDIVLIGEAIKHTYKFIKTIEELGRIGIGTKRGRFFIKDVYVDRVITFKNFINERLDKIENILIELLTPLKIKEEKVGIYYNDFSFNAFFKLLIKRIINLNNLYCGGLIFDKEKIESEKQYFIKMAELVEAKSYTKWKDYRRFSLRQKKPMKIGGQIGVIELKGEMSPFYPYLRLGEIIGVGQNTTSGFGRYRISPSEKFKVNV